MVFENENTWYKAVNSGNIEEFHRLYDEAVKKVSKELGKTYPLYIDGEERLSKEGIFPDISPADTRVVIGYFQKGTREDAKAAILAAKKAFPSWSRTPWPERVKIFRRAADLMTQRKFDLAALQTLENGKNRFEAVADVDEAIDYLRYYSEQMEVNDGFDQEMYHTLPDEKTRSILKPYGVWAVIAPFNFPLAISVGMSTGALITGNTIVLKPASDTPLQSLKFYQILQEAGLPKSVMNYVTGSGETVGAELVDNLDVSGVVFTGSKDVGVSSCKAFSQRVLRPFIAEMGGKNAVIVTDKADIEKAVEGVVRGAFGYGGQKCSATSRVYIFRNVKEKFLNLLVEKTKELKIGNPLQAESFLGPVINERAYKNYQKYIEVAKMDGRILTGGRILNDEVHRHGYFVEPTIIDALPKDHRLFKEELFLPIIVVTEVDSLDEALSLANDVEYGLTAGIFSEDRGEVETFFDRIEAGVTYANRRIGASTGAMVGVQPFGGWKMSGTSGRGAGSIYYLPQFMREQSQTRYK